MEQDGIQIVVKRGKVVLHKGWIDSWSELDLIPDFPCVQELPVCGKK